jgi:hypothetical protein
MSTFIIASLTNAWGTDGQKLMDRASGIPLKRKPETSIKALNCNSERIPCPDLSDCRVSQRLNNHMCQVALLRGCKPQNKEA